MEFVTSLDQLDINKIYSYADYLRWRFDDRVELHNGRIRNLFSPPLTAHQEVVGRIDSDIHQYLRRKSCGVFIAPFDVRLPHSSETSDEQIFTTVQPDVFIVCDKTKIDRRGCLGVPDMVVEVLSPGNTTYDTREKYSLYEEFGVKEYWIVSPGE